MDLILKGSNMYRSGKVLTFSDKESLLVRTPIEVVGTEEDRYYTVKKDDEISLIAHRHYSPRVGSGSRYWWVIADANNIHNPLDLSDMVGKSILVPNIMRVLLDL